MKRRPRLLPLLDWIPTLSPRFARPEHLAPVAELFERIERGEAVRACVSAPPRHAKTTTEEHGVARFLARDPRRRVIWASYGQRFAERSSKRIREVSGRACVPIAGDARAKANWRTGVADGGMWCTSVGGPVTGEGADLLLIDDPTKGRAEAESAASRESTWDWFNDDAYTRLEPGASCIVSGARWHEDDLIGRLIEGGDWEYVRLPAIDDEGRALWPDRFTASALREIAEQLGDYGWSSLYQGRPLPRGGLVFAGDVQFYDDAPASLRVGKGVDLAYTARTSRDSSAAVVLGRDQATGHVYVLDVLKAQATVDAFLPRMRMQSVTYPGPYRFHTSTTEQGIAQLTRLLDETDVRIEAKLAKFDKFTRAQPVAASWNAAKIFLPKRAPWVDAFVHELKSFSGVKDRRDDQVDAFASAFDVVNRRKERGATKDDYAVFAGRPFEEVSGGWSEDGPQTSGWGSYGQRQPQHEAVAVAVVRDALTRRPS